MTEQSAQEGAKTTGAMLVDRTFGPWFWSNIISNSGTWLYNVTAAVVIYNLTGSALLVGGVSMAQFGTLVLLGPLAGALCDQLDRRRMLLASQSVAAVSAAAIAAAVFLLGVENLPGVWPIIVATLGIGVGLALAKPAQQSLVPALVRDVDLESAVALTNITFNVGRALGPAAAGALLLTLGPDAAFTINALSFVPLITTLALIRPVSEPRSRQDGGRSFWAGLQHVRRHPFLAKQIFGLAVVGFASDPVTTLTPPLAATLGGGDGMVAAFVSAFGVAAVATGFVAGNVQRRLGPLRTGRDGLALMGVGAVLCAVAPVPAVALVGFVVMGVGSVLGVTSFTSVLHRHVPDSLRGRIMALWAVGFLGTRPLAAFADGLAADLFGARWAMLIALAVAVAGALVAQSALRSDLRARTPSPTGSPA